MKHFHFIAGLKNKYLHVHNVMQAKEGPHYNMLLCSIATDTVLGTCLYLF